MKSTWLLGGAAIAMLSTGFAILAFLTSELFGLSGQFPIRIAIVSGLIIALITIGILADYTVLFVLKPNNGPGNRAARQIKINLNLLFSYPLHWGIALWQSSFWYFSRLRKSLYGLPRRPAEQESAVFAVTENQAPHPHEPHSGAAWDKTSLDIENDPGIRAMKVRVAVAPYDADTYWELARRYVKLGGYTQAIEQYKAVLDYRPEFHEARFELIECYRKVQRWDEALPELHYLHGVRRFSVEAQNIIEQIKFEMENM